MNTITVTAHGCPNSLARRIQHDPAIGVEALRLLRRIVNILDEGGPLHADGGLHLESRGLLNHIDNTEGTLP